MPEPLSPLRRIGRGAALGLWAALAVLAAAAVAIGVVGGYYLAWRLIASVSEWRAATAAGGLMRGAGGGEATWRQWLVGVGWPVGSALFLVVVPTALVVLFVDVLRGAERPALIRRYLSRKLAPLFAVVAVMLCTAMVIVVSSVMGGFLVMMRQTVRTLEGDLTVESSLVGFAHYEELMADLKKVPEVAAVAPMIHTGGLIKIADEAGPFPGQRYRDRVRLVEVIGIDPPSLSQVTNYRDTLYWTTQKFLDTVAAEGPRAGAFGPGQAEVERELERWRQIDLVGAGMSFKVPPGLWQYRNGGQPMPEAPGMVAGIEVLKRNFRNELGQYEARYNRSLGAKVTVTVMPVTEEGAPVQPAYGSLVVVNEFKSGLYEIDSNRVYVPFGLLQQMLMMQPADEANPETGKPTGRKTPGRASAVMVKGAKDATGKDVTLEALEAAVGAAVERFHVRHPEVPRLDVITWQDRHGAFLSAVEHEKGMLIFLFGIISLVSVFLILVIFRNIVTEKTRDIGVLRAIGASRQSVAAVFLGYGLALGVLGAGLGLTLGATVAVHVNQIQDVLYQVFGFRMWNPQTYYFDKIPVDLDVWELSFIVAVAVLSSVLGSVLPAIQAARLHPVEALRYE